MTDFSCLRNLLVCVFPEVSYTSFPSRTLYPHYVMTLYSSFCTSGSVIWGRGEFYKSLLLLLILSMEDFSGSVLKLMSLGGMCYIPLMTGVSILILLTPDPLIIGRRYLRRRDFSLHFSFSRIAWIPAYY